jgi:Cu-Zn family superoxide dismutase
MREETMLKVKRVATSMAMTMSLCTPCSILADAPADTELTVPIWAVDEHGAASQLGTIKLTDTRYGLLVTPDLRGLAPGLHATHVHENPSCAATQMGDHTMIAGAAGEHFDPQGTKRHAGPYGNGHLGDLPNLTAEPDGRVTVPVLAPRLKTADLLDRALIIHEGADRYDDSDTHGQHSKGGPRMYCGLIR